MIRTGAGAALFAVAACAAQPLPAPAARLADLAWIGGCWESADHRQFERWGPERDGARAGSGTLLDGAGKVVFSEMLRLEQRAAGVVYVGQPQGQAPVEFPLAAAGPNWARFENPAHDDPKIIRYAREGETLKAWTSAGAREKLVLDARLSGCD